MKNIQRMQEISNELLNFAKIFNKQQDHTYTLSGEKFKTIYGIDDCEISIGVLKNNIEPHIHNETEHYLCVDGSLTVKIGDQKVIKMNQNSHCMIPPNTIHSLETTKCMLLVVRIPSSRLMDD